MCLDNKRPVARKGYVVSYLKLYEVFACYQSSVIIPRFRGIERDVPTFIEADKQAAGVTKIPPHTTYLPPFISLPLTHVTLVFSAAPVVRDLLSIIVLG